MAENQDADIDALLDLLNADDEDDKQILEGRDEKENSSNRTHDLEAERRALQAKLDEIDTKLLKSRAPVKPATKYRLCNLDFNQPSTSKDKQDNGDVSLVRNAGCESDDDENESTLDESGRKTKDLLNRQTFVSAIDTINKNERAKQQQNLMSIAKNVGKKLTASVDADVYDPYFGIRIRNPRFASTVFETFCADRVKMRIRDLQNGKLLPDDSLIMGVIVGKTGEKRSANGNSYILWQLHDLFDCDRNSLRIFLFGKAKEKHWKMGLGIVVAILGLQSMKSDSNQSSRKTEVAGRLLNDNQIIELGYSNDYTLCQSRNKFNESCRNFVNRSQESVCTSHLVKKSRQISAKRGETVSYGSAANVMGGRSNIYTAPAIRPTTMRSLTPQPVRNVTPSLTLEQVRQHRSRLTTNNTSLVGKSSNELLLERLQNPSAGSRALLATLGATGNEALSSKANHNETIAARALNRAIETNRSISNVTPLSNHNPTDILASFKSLPRRSPIKKKKVERRLVDLSTPPKQQSSMDPAKMRAVEILRRRGMKLQPIKRTPETSNECRKRMRDENCHISTQQSASSISHRCDDKPFTLPKNGKQLKLGEINISMHQIRELAHRQLKNEDLIEMDERERQEQYFKGLEVKEQIENKMTSTTEVPNINVVTCEKCDYTWHGQSQYCKDAGHQVRRHTATRRFFKCNNCQQRTIAYSMLPAKACRTCNTHGDWSKVAMKDERKVRNVELELKIRGDEQKFVNR